MKSIFASHPLRALFGAWHDPRCRLLILFGLEGLLLQYAVSLNSLANNLYATNLGATDTQIGLVQTVPNMVAVLFLIPFGLLGGRTRRSRTVPLFLLLFLGISYFGYAAVPWLSIGRMEAFFAFLGMTVGGIAIYNAQWQNFFGDAVDMPQRNGVLTVRNRCLFFTGVIVPLLCGTLMTAAPHVEEKLRVLQVFYALAGVCMLLQAFVLWRIPCPARRDEELSKKAGLAVFRQALGHMAHHRAFRSFFVCIMLFYFSWHFDWSLWYLAEVQYAGMNEAQLSLFQALCSVCQMIFIGFFAGLCRKKSEHYAILWACAGLWLCPVMVAGMLWVPMQARAVYFIIIGLVGNIPQCVISMCTVQMLLQVCPRANRALIISLYTLFVTLSNSLLPLLGVQVYTALGSNEHAVFWVNSIESLVRAGVFILMAVRYRRLKKAGDLFRPLAE